MTVLLLGAGSMAAGYAAVLKAQKRSFTVIGRGEASANRFQAETGIAPLLGGLGAVPAPAKPESAAIVAVPVVDLAEATRRLASAGYSRILVEKPAGLDGNEISALAEAVSKTGARVFVAYNRRFYASIAAARRMLEADGGPSSIHFDFSELVPRILTPDKTEVLLANWFYANATHIIDLAFHLAGEPASISADTAGKLDWHEPAIFTGHGRTKTGALMSYHANWTTPGRWGIEVRSRNHRFILQPLEQLKQQALSGFALNDIAIDDAKDKEFKPGLFDQVAAFLSDAPEATPLLTLDDHVRRIPAFEIMRMGGVADFSNT